MPWRAALRLCPDASVPGVVLGSERQVCFVPASRVQHDKSFHVSTNRFGILPPNNEPQTYYETTRTIDGAALRWCDKALSAQTFGVFFTSRATKG